MITVLNVKKKFDFEEFKKNGVIKAIYTVNAGKDLRYKFSLLSDVNDDTFIHGDCGTLTIQDEYEQNFSDSMIVAFAYIPSTKEKFNVTPEIIMTELMRQSNYNFFNREKGRFTNDESSKDIEGNIDGSSIID